MPKVFLAFAFGACLASPVAALIGTMPLGPSTTPVMGKMLDGFPENGVFDCDLACPVDVELDQTDYQIEQCETKCDVEWHDAPADIVVPTVTVVGQVPPRMRPRPVPPSAPACHLHRLEIGGSPSAPFVLVCG